MAWAETHFQMTEKNEFYSFRTLVKHDDGLYLLFFVFVTIFILTNKIGVLQIFGSICELIVLANEIVGGFLKIRQ